MSELHSLDAERAVLGAALLDGSCLDGLQLDAGDFYSAGNGAIFGAMRRVRSTGAPLDVTLVREALAQEDYLQAVGGDEYLLSLTNTIPVVANTPFFAKVVRDHARARAVSIALRDGVSEIEGGADVDAAAARVRDRLGGLTTAARVDPFAPIEALAKLEDDWLSTAPPPVEYLLTVQDESGARDGVLTTATVGMLAGTGGVGKTIATTQFAIAVATGTLWLGTYSTRRAAPALCLFGEETDGTARRRVFDGARVAMLSEDERDLARRNLHVKGLRSHDVRLVVGEGTQLEQTGLLALVIEHVERIGAVLVVLDPVARFAPTAESDTAAGTLFTQALEKIAACSSRPVVLCVHHTNKSSRQAGGDGQTHDARGVTTMTDGPRWVANLTPTKSGVTFAVTKSNECAKPPKLALVQDRGGALRLPTATERAKIGANDQAVIEAVVSAVRAAGAVGIHGWRALYDACPGIGKPAVGEAVRDAKGAHLISETRNGNTCVWTAP